jgi:hypothetical protein
LKPCILLVTPSITREIDVRDEMRDERGERREERGERREERGEMRDERGKEPSDKRIEDERRGLSSSNYRS